MEATLQLEKALAGLIPPTRELIRSQKLAAFEALRNGDTQLQERCNVNVANLSAQMLLTLQAKAPSTPFSCKALHEVFSNLEVMKPDTGLSYAYSITQPKGLSTRASEVGTVSFSDNTVYFYKDNFPAPKRYYSSQIPITTYAEFISDLSRVGLDLELIPA
jgi:hypothetical protein